MFFTSLFSIVVYNYKNKRVIDYYFLYIACYNEFKMRYESILMIDCCDLLYLFDKHRRKL